MTNDRTVKQLLDNARHESVTKKRLTKLKGGLTARYLYNKPLIDYLEDDEQPHFILAARSNTPEFSGDNPPSWSGKTATGMPMYLITNKRMLIVVGSKPDDHVFEIPLTDLQIVDYSTGATKHRIDIKTEEYDIKIPIGNMYDADEIESVVEYIKNYQEDSSQEDENQEDSQLTGETETLSVDEIINNSRHNSVSEDILTNTTSDGIFSADYLRDEALIEYLEPGEQPHYIFANDVPPNITEGNVPSLNGGKGYKAINMISDRRWLVVYGHKNGDRHFEIRFEDITYMDLNDSKLGELTIETDELSGVFTLSLVEDMSEELTEIKDYITPKTQYRPSTSETNKSVIFDYDSGSDKTYAKLTVPTKSSGATFTSQGWNIGGDIVRRTSSKGQIEEESWENYVKKLVIFEDHLQIGVTYGDMSITSDNRIKQNIRIDLREITDVREGMKSFEFETPEDVYQFKLGKKGVASMADPAVAQKAVQKIKKAVRDAPKPEKTDSNTESTTSSEPDPMEKLSKIKKLNDQDVITEEEFEEKKKELLDQI